MLFSARFNNNNLISLIYLICERKLDMFVHLTISFFVAEGNTIITLPYRFSLRAGLQCCLLNEPWFVIVSVPAFKQGNETLVSLFKIGCCTTS